MHQFNDIANPELKAFNRAIIARNLYADRGKGFALRYLSAFKGKELIDVYNMLTSFKEETLKRQEEWFINLQDLHLRMNQLSVTKANEDFMELEDYVRKEEKKARDKQIGGDHYKTLTIQPSEYIVSNGLGWYEGNAIKYVTRHKQKGQRADIEKAIHYLELLLEEYDKYADA